MPWTENKNRIQLQINDKIKNKIPKIGLPIGENWLLSKSQITTIKVPINQDHKNIFSQVFIFFTSTTPQTTR